MGLRRAADTVGEFAGITRNSGFRLPGEPILPSVRLIGPWREFADSIGCYGKALMSSPTTRPCGRSSVTAAAGTIGGAYTMTDTAAGVRGASIGAGHAATFTYALTRPSPSLGTFLLGPVLSVPSVHPCTTIARPYLSDLGSALLDYAKAWFGVTRKLSSRELGCGGGKTVR
jgi:hypothetical protein